MNSPPVLADFMVTKEHRRSPALAHALRRDRYIGLCYGPPGVGKTLSARQYAGWDIVGPFLQAFRPLDVPVPQQAMANRTIIYTPKVHTTAHIVDKEITFLHDRLSQGIEWEIHPPKAHTTAHIVDKEITFLHERLSWGIEWELQTPKDFTTLSKSCGPCAELL